MDVAKASRTALMAAFFRAQHHQHDDPKIFDDPFAQRLLSSSEVESSENALLAAPRDTSDIPAASPERRVVLSRLLRHHPAPAAILARARYAEDRLLEAVHEGVEQYVMVGAGLETFTLRHQELRDRLQVFEIDHPATQAFKQHALGRARIARPPNLHFVPADLEAVSVADALRGSSFMPQARSVFSWHGVIPYLTLQAVRRTLQSIRSVAAPRSLLLFSYLDGDAFRAEKASTRIRQMIEATRSIGEAMITGFDLPVLQAEPRGAGFDLVEDLDPEEQQRRYFDTRTDGYHATEHSHCACATPSAV